ncbi:hypothetical protein GIB67_016590 [Kingdonia uniflora]|uniref:Uncharacterized protein n=1 Tax=Kingdonia uniflora TaxID=39325 RepID=A0A7J7MZC1_9MAGN|nr:hypothetical protein GIB67_016590 [Kingdonia uniflora]
MAVLHKMAVLQKMGKIDIQNVHTKGIIAQNGQNGYIKWTYKMDIQRASLHKIDKMDIQNGHTKCIITQNEQNRYTKWTYKRHHSTK